MLMFRFVVGKYFGIDEMTPEIIEREFKDDEEATQNSQTIVDEVQSKINGKLSRFGRYNFLLKRLLRIDEPAVVEKTTELKISSS